MSVILSNSTFIGYSNVIVNATTTLSPILGSDISGKPKTDILNRSPYVSKSSGDQYVRMRYQGGDRAGIAIDTSGMNDSHSVKAFYIVTDFSSRNNRRHVVLGYDDLSSNKRFISKKNLLNSYSPGGEDGVSNIVLGDSTFERHEDFPIPSGLHLLSRRGLDISKSQLNGILGTFPTSGEEGGEQYIREIIIFTNDVSDAQHRNIVNYFLSKWNIDREPLTNIYSYYNHANNHILENGADGRVSTYFQAAGSIQRDIENNRVLFEAIYAPSVLNTSSDAYSSLVQGVSKGKESLMLKSGCNLHSDGIRVPFRVEILRTNDNRWFVLSNVPVNNNSGFKQFLFFLESSQNDFIGYRLVANGSANSDKWFIIDDFSPSIISNEVPLISVFDAPIGNEIYNTDTDVLSNGFTFRIEFNQEVYGLTTDDFIVTNVAVDSLSLRNISANTYDLTVLPHKFLGTNTSELIKYPTDYLQVFIQTNAVTNVNGWANGTGGSQRIQYHIYNPFRGTYLHRNGGLGVTTPMFWM